jgi:hypothetical protein
VLRAKQFLGAAHGQTLERVHVGAAIVVARRWHALGVLVAEHRRLRRRHYRRTVVLRRDHHQRVALPRFLGRENRSGFGIKGSIVHAPLL